MGEGIDPNTALVNHPPGDSHHGAIGFHIPHHNRPSTDPGVGADRDRPKHLGAGTHHNVFGQGWVPFAVLFAGAAQGAGLGHDFLRHIERTRLLIHVVDGGADDPLGDLKVVEKELEAYGHGLVDRQRLLVVNKLELLDESGRDALVEALEQDSGRRPLLISAVMGQGLKDLLNQVWIELGV